jgi:hypothetical protein
MISEDAIVQVSEASQTKKWFGLAASRRVAVPRAVEGKLRFLVLSLRGGGQELREIAPAEREIELDPNRPSRFVAVRPSGLSLELPFSGIARDGSGHGYDLLLRGSWRLASPRLFLDTCGLSLASPQSPLSNARALCWMIQRVGTRVRDAVREQDAQDLVHKDALPKQWWETQLNRWLADCGIQVVIEEAQWSSAEAEREAEEQKRLAEMERAQKAIQRERDLERAKLDAEVRQKAELDRIQQDAKLSTEQKEHELQLARKRHLKELLEADAAIEAARREAERAALEHEVVIAKLRNDREVASRAEQQQEQADQRHKNLMDQIARMQAALEDGSRQFDSLFATLSSPDRRAAFQAAERLVSPEFGFRPQLLSDLGFSVSPQMLVQYLREKAVGDGQPVTLRKRELTTRDIGTAKVKALAINTSLQLEFTTARAGYVTVLNIGTSGSVWLHVPNAFISPCDAKAAAGRCYQVPGSELLPWERLREAGIDYLEIGPPGWEHLAVFVSNKPLIDPVVACRSRPAEPLVRLSPEEIACVCQRLADTESYTWSVGTLSFLVG